MTASIVFLDEAGQENTIEFDATLSVKPSLGADITQLPVETKQNITDHIRPRLDLLTLEVFVSNTPVPFTQDYTTTRLDLAPVIPPPPGVDDGDSFLGSVPTPGGINRAIQSGIGDLISGALSPPDLRHVDVEAFVAGVSDRVKAFFDAVDDLRRAGTECRVITKLKEFDGMHVANFDPLRSLVEGDGVRAVIEFQEVRVSETSTQAFPVPEETRAELRRQAGARSGKAPKGGAATEAKNRTLAAQLLDAGGF